MLQCLKHAHAALTQETYRSKFYSLLYLKEEVHSKCIPPFWQTGTAGVLFYLCYTGQLDLYVDQQEGFYHYF